MSDREQEVKGKDPDHLQLTWARVLREVRSQGVTTSAHLREVMSLSPSRTNGLISQLERAGLIEASTGRFKRRRSITLAADLACVVGIDMTMDQVRVAVADLQYGLLNDPTRTTRTIDAENIDETLKTIAALVAQEVATHSGDRPLLGVGLGLPGPIERTAGRAESDHLLPRWKGKSVVRLLSGLLRERGLAAARVAVVNDASLGALGVFTRATWGDPSDETDRPDDLVYVRVTHGVGMGLVIKGHLVTGAHGFAGEIGHVRVEPDGPICTRCNRRGCLEALASERAVIDILRHHAWADRADDPGPRNIQDVIRAEHDARARDAVGQAGFHIGFILAAVANVLNPRWIVLGGALTETDLFREKLETTLHQYALAQATQELRLTTWSRLFDDNYPGGDVDLGSNLSPELLGALAIVVDEFADDFLRPMAFAAAHGQSQDVP